MNYSRRIRHYSHPIFWKLSSRIFLLCDLITVFCKISKILGEFNEVSNFEKSLIYDSALVVWNPYRVHVLSSTEALNFRFEKVGKRMGKTQEKNEKKVRLHCKSFYTQQQQYN